MKTEEINKKVIRQYPPNTEFISIFGAKDIVSLADKFYLTSYNEVFIYCKSGDHRCIYNGNSWAKIINKK